MTMSYECIQGEDSRPPHYHEYYTRYYLKFLRTEPKKKNVEKSTPLLSPNFFSDYNCALASIFTVIAQPLAISFLSHFISSFLLCNSCLIFILYIFFLSVAFHLLTTRLWKCFKRFRAKHTYKSKSKSKRK